jgi:hypothetical protein
VSGRTKRRKRAQQIAANAEPLRVGGSNYKTHVLTRLGENVLVLKPSASNRFFALLLMTLGVGVHLFGLYSLRWEPQWIGWLIGGFGFVFVLAGVAVFVSPARVEFDLREGVLRRKWLFRQRSWPLESVRAVQLVEGGWHGEGDSESAPYFTYQMNLVLNDESQPRINLTNHANWDATWTAASELAEFLNVPLLNEVTKDES